MPRPRGSAQELERRRHRALKLLDEGRSLHEVAERIGCHASSVMRWRNARRQGGKRALKVRKASGRPPKLNEEQRAELLELLLEGARAHGYRTELWTTQRIAEVIQSKFRVSYHRDHVGRLMRSLGWSCQKPERRAVERDEAAVERWKREVWPEVKKTPKGWGPTSSSPTKAASN
jgi:transposase